KTTSKKIIGTYIKDSITTVQFEPTECKHELAPDSNTSCGFVLVPENRNDPISPTIKLYLTIFKNRGTSTLSGPLFFLTGGPGASTADAVSIFENACQLSSMDDFVNSFRGNRDFIVVDQRGTNFSEPSLYCSKETGPLREKAYVLNSSEQAKERVAAIEACALRLQSEGHDLSAYNTFENAADVNAIRIALGYDKINIYGVSYGTRLTMTVMKLFPDMLRSVVIDSVLPPEINPFEQQPNGIMYALHSFFQASKDAFPETEKKFYEIIERLSEIPVDTVGTNADIKLNGCGAPTVTTSQFTISIDDEMFVSYIIGQLRATPYNASLPLLISQMHEDGDYTKVADAWISNTNFFFPAGGPGSSDPSLGMFESMTATSDGFYTTIGKVLKLIDFHNANPGINQYASDNFVFSEPAVQGLWPTKPVGPDIQYPLISDIPTMLLAGAIDSGTPPLWSEEAARFLENSFHFSILSGHATEFLPCAAEMMDNFLNDPEVAPKFECPTTFTWTTNSKNQETGTSRKFRGNKFMRLYN
ncbi:MAG: alpha/beta fold hydrolase, partial [Candidatus Anammoxibacter sp.]